MDNRTFLMTKQNVQAQIQKRLKACRHSIKSYFYCNNVCMNYLQGFEGPGEYLHQGYPSSRPSNMRAGARAGAFVFARKQTHPARAPY